jgi:hypothetical protein
MKYSHQYGCLDDSRNELQQILKPLDATIGCRIASLHCRILEEQQQQLITGDNEQSTKSGNTQQQQESERGNNIQKNITEEENGIILREVMSEKSTTMRTKFHSPIFNG